MVRVRHLVLDQKADGVVGYDNGVLGGLLTAPSFIDQFHMNASLQGTVTALFQAGCAIGCFATSLLSARFGRLTLTHVGTAFICVGGALQASSHIVAQLIVGRIVAGIGLGLITSSTSVLQSETAPRQLRGRLLATSLSSLIVGQVLANWLDYGMNFYTTDISWRFPLAFQGVISLLMSFLLFFMPECKFKSAAYVQAFKCDFSSSLVNKSRT